MLRLMQEKCIVRKLISIIHKGLKCKLFSMTRQDLTFEERGVSCLNPAPGYQWCVGQSVGARVQTDDVSSNTRNVIDTNTDMKVRSEMVGY